MDDTHPYPTEQEQHNQDFSTALACLETEKRFAAATIPLREKLAVLKKQCPKKKGQKQMKITQCIKKAIRKAKHPTNFQGFPLEKCQYTPNLKLTVYVPVAYARRTLSTIPENFRKCCGGCLLTPCIMEEFHTHFVHEAKVNFLTKQLPEDETHRAVCRSIRVKMVKVFNKTYLLKTLPHPHDIPFCAQASLKKIVREALHDNPEHENNSSEEDTDTTTEFLFDD